MEWFVKIESKAKFQFDNDLYTTYYRIHRVLLRSIEFRMHLN